MTASDFRTTGCSWCHPGGGPLEYDRQGYRFDGAPGLFFGGANPAPAPADYSVFGTLAGADASAYAGAGFFEVTSTTGVYPPEQLINAGTMKAVLDPATGTYKTVGRKYASVAAGGVAEADCLQCHFSGQYTNLERNYAFPGATMPKLAASLGLVGQGTGQPGLLVIGSKGSPGVNPNPSPTAWSWNERVGVPGTAGNPVTLLASDIVGSPRKENCAACHFPDRSVASLGCVDATKCGPSSKPLGFTVFQKYMAPGSTRDGDEIPGIAGRDGNNDVAWNAAKGRTEGGKRGESINDNLNHDAHMKWPAYGSPGMNCTDCHYSLEGHFKALKDAAGNVIQPAIDVHGSTTRSPRATTRLTARTWTSSTTPSPARAVTWIGRTPGRPARPHPAAQHAGMPAFHFDKISCKTCHIPILNGPVDQDVADFTAGPYQTFERTQITEAPATGTNRRPLYVWRMTEHGAGHLEIQPVGVMSVAVLGSASTQVGDEAGAVSATYQRLAKRAAEQLRAQYGDQNADGFYDWRLNALQGGDRVADRQPPTGDHGLHGAGGLHPRGAAEPRAPLLLQPVLDQPQRPPAGRDDQQDPRLEGGRRVPDVPLEQRPREPELQRGVRGLLRQAVHALRPADRRRERPGPDRAAGEPAAHGKPRAGQHQVPVHEARRHAWCRGPLGHRRATRRQRREPGRGAGLRPRQGAVVDGAQEVVLRDLGDLRPERAHVSRRGLRCTRPGDPKRGHHAGPGLLRGRRGRRRCVRRSGHQYTFADVVDDHTLAATFLANPSFTIAATAGAHGTITPTGATSYLGGVDATYTITPDPDYRIGTLIVDGAANNPSSTRIFRSVDADHTIAATFVPDVFDITASTRGAGTISPAGTTAVTRGGSVTYTMTPAPGYTVDRVIVDGVNQGEDPVVHL